MSYTSHEPLLCTSEVQACAWPPSCAQRLQSLVCASAAGHRFVVAEVVVVVDVAVAVAVVDPPVLEAFEAEPAAAVAVLEAVGHVSVVVVVEAVRCPACTVAPLAEAAGAAEAVLGYGFEERGIVQRFAPKDRAACWKLFVAQHAWK